MSLTLYRTLPQAEQRAVNECRRDGIKAYPIVIGTRIAKPSRHAKRGAPKPIIAAGYVVAHGKPVEARHVGSAIGQVAMSEIVGLCKSVRAERYRITDYPSGTRVRISCGPYADIVATVTAERGSVLQVEVTMLGRRVQTTVHVAHAERCCARVRSSVPGERTPDGQQAYRAADHRP